MLPDIERTIVALASGPQGAPRAIVRLTGPATCQLLDQVCGWNAGKTATSAPAIRSITGPERLLATILIPEIERSIPVTVLVWPDHRSYTGQPSAELHMIGSMPLVEAVIARCCALGASPAERGEFTLRAFLAGKLDLAQAEAVLGVIEADTRDELTSALSQLGGNLAPAIAPLRQKIVNVVADLEAGLDFVDEDIEFISQDQLIHQLTSVQTALVEFAERLQMRSSTRQLPRVVLVGLPNSGKSSLFNALCGQELAIVADIEGTTRDYLEQSLAFDVSAGDERGSRAGLASIEATLIDTAGWEQLAGDCPRAMAQQQLIECLVSADVCLLCLDTSADLASQRVLTAVAAALEEQASHGHCACWLVVGTKSDRIEQGSHDWTPMMAALQRLLQAHANGVEMHFEPLLVSSRTLQGLARLKAAIGQRLVSQREHESSPGGTANRLTLVHHTSVRCQAALAAAASGLDAALETARMGGGEELVAAELRLVLDELATIIGEVHSDDILGEIFSRFCIGK